MMDINTAINLAVEGNAILFAGAGFSYGAKNLNGVSFHTGMVYGILLRKIVG